MTLDKAIEILTLYLPKHRWPPNPDLQDAMQLGIEALKMIKEGRYRPGGMFFHDLPGEDSFIDTSRSRHTIKQILESPLGREPEH